MPLPDNAAMLTHVVRTILTYDIPHFNSRICTSSCQ